MKIIKVTKEYFETEGDGSGYERIYFCEPLEKVISVEDMQKILNEELIVEFHSCGAAFYAPELD
jgi:hypothetical protein